MVRSHSHVFVSSYNTNSISEIHVSVLLQSERIVFKKMKKIVSNPQPIRSRGYSGGKGSNFIGVGKELFCRFKADQEQRIKQAASKFS